MKRVEAKEGSTSAADDLGRLLLSQKPSMLARHGETIKTLAATAKSAPVKRACYAALVLADASPDRVWAATAADGGARNYLIESIGLIPASEAKLRSAFQPHLIALLNEGKTEGGRLRAVLTALPLTGPENAAANFKVAAQHLIEGKERNAAAKALIKFPKTTWDATQAKPITDAVLAYGKTIPAADRSKPEYVEIIAAAKEMAALQGDAGKPVLAELKSVSVDVFVVHTVHEQLRFDTTKLDVTAGKQFEVIFENDDVMPHNFVIVPPGKHMEIGTAAMTMTPSQLDKEGRAFLPKSHEKEISSSPAKKPPSR